MLKWWKSTTQFLGRDFAVPKLNSCGQGFYITSWGGGVVGVWGGAGCGEGIKGLSFQFPLDAGRSLILAHVATGGHLPGGTGQNGKNVVEEGGGGRPGEFAQTPQGPGALDESRIALSIFCFERPGGQKTHPGSTSFAQLLPGARNLIGAGAFHKTGWGGGRAPGRFGSEGGGPGFFAFQKPFFDPGQGGTQPRNRPKKKTD